MEFKKIKNRLRGPLVASVTPFKENFDLDLDGLREVTRYIIDGGIKKGRGVLLSGGAGGEFPSMTIEERKKVLSTAMEVAKGKVPVCFGAQHTSMKGVLELCNHAEKLGADFVQLSPPFYWETSEEEVFNFYKMVNDDTDIGIMVYNATWEGVVEGRGINKGLMNRLAELENVIALKWSSPSQQTYLGMIKDFSDKVAIFDNSLKFTSTLLGENGIIDPIGNFAPEYVSRCWSLLEKKDYEGALKEMWRFYLPWYEWVRKVQKEGIHGEGGIIKPAMQILGLPSGPPRPPYNLTPSEELLTELREMLTNIGLSGDC